MLAALSPRTLSLPDYFTITAYFAVNLAIGWWCTRRKRASSGDYFTGGGRVGWPAMAISFFATGASSISFMALPAKTFQSDWMSYGSAPAQGLAGLLMGFVFVGLLRRLNLITVFGYLEQRFDCRVRLLGAGLAILLKICGRMSVVMLLPALALTTVTGLNVYLSILLMGAVTTIYAMEGGFEAVVWTDVLQVGVMVAGIAVALHYLTGGVSGGLSGILGQADAAGKLRMISWSLDATKPTVWVFVGMLLATVFTYVGDQPLMQRMLASTDTGEARRTVLLGTVIGLISSVVFFFIGTALWAFYRAHPDRLDPHLPNDAIFPYFIANELPRGMVGLIVAGLFASAMGALSSAINATASIVVSDFQGTLRPMATESQRLRLARSATVVCGVVATVMACWLAFRDVASLWEEFLKLIALVGGGFPGVFALGLLTRRANSTGAIVGALTSIPITWWVQNHTPISVFLHTFIAIGSCVVIGYVVSLATGTYRPSKALTGLTVWDRAKTNPKDGNVPT